LNQLHLGGPKNLVKGFAARSKKHLGLSSYGGVGKGGAAIYPLGPKTHWVEHGICEFSSYVSREKGETKGRDD